MANIKVVYLPAGAGGAKVGLDDFLATGQGFHGLTPLAQSTLREPPPQDEESPALHYRETPSGIAWIRPTREGDIEMPLTNFTANILTDIVEDDGIEVHHTLEIEARLAGRVRRFHVAATHFGAMQWPMQHLGPGAIVSPGFGLADHARAAIQFLSTAILERRIYTHTGWRLLEGVWGYLHAGGAIGPNGPIAQVQVHLPEALGRFSLPAPPDGHEREQAILASLKLLDVAPDRITIPLYAAIWRAALGAADFSVQLAGLTGAGKTALAALAQQHYGSEMDAEHLPASWSSTGNALEGYAFQAKEALLVIDDFAPSGSQADVLRLHREAERVLRAQGNRSGRLRMRPDSSLRPAKPPRGLILSTGEDIPRAQSVRARVLILEMQKQDLDWTRLTACQADAANGHYALALAGYVHWCAARYEQLRTEVRTTVTTRRRTAIGAETHRRIPTMIANLQFGFATWLDFAEDTGAVTSNQAADLWDRARAALEEAARVQEQHQRASDPTQRFLELLSGAIVSGRAHVASTSGEIPDNYNAWGWRATVTGSTVSGRTIPIPQGERIGWVDGLDLYLEPDASFAVVQRLAHDSGESLPIASKTLHKRLHEKGLLASTEAGRHKLTVRRTLEGQRRSVLHLSASLLSAPGRAQ
jgi:hypothetical protein